jgi:hypothetical protein
MILIMSSSIYLLELIQINLWSRSGENDSPLRTHYADIDSNILTVLTVRSQ